MRFISITSRAWVKPWTMRSISTSSMLCSFTRIIRRSLLFNGKIFCLSSRKGRGLCPCIRQLVLFKRSRIRPTRGRALKSHQGAVFSPRIVNQDHPAVSGVGDIKAWDETYFHHRHNSKNRTVLMVRDPMPGDPHQEPEPWTWVRTEGKGRVFYTASGHDERVWNNPGFQALLKKNSLGGGRFRPQAL